MSRLLWGNLHTVHKRQFFAALRAAGGVVSFRYPGAYAAPDPAGTFCVNKKYPKSHLNLRFKNPFLGFACPANPRRGLKGCAAGLLERRSLRISSPSSAALVLVELRLPPFQRGTPCKGHALYILRGEMLRLASLLPEFDVVMEMQGAGEVTGPQLMAEIGDVRRFTHKGSLVAFAGMDAPPFQSGTFDSKSRRISKRGSPHLRKTLFMVASTILQHSDPANPIFQFMDKKRAEGKHFYVYTLAGAAKFLRIYYARVKAHLMALDAGTSTAA